MLHFPCHHPFWYEFANHPQGGGAGYIVGPWSGIAADNTHCSSFFSHPRAHSVSLFGCRFQQPYDLFFAILAVIISTVPIVDTDRFIRQETVDKSFGSLGFDKGYKCPDS
jgi:hypothetical protein